MIMQYMNPVNYFLATFQKNCLNNNHIFLCCPGPGLTELDPTFLQKTGVHSLAINTAYPYVRPSMWVGMDAPFCYDQNLLYEPFVKFFGTRFKQDWFFNTRLCEFANTYFMGGGPGELKDIFDRLSFDSVLLWNKNTWEMALHLCIYMGYKNIYLAGVNFGGKDYHYGDILSDKNRKTNADKMVTQLARFKEFVPFAKKRGINFYSCTKDSPISDFMPYMYPSDVVKKIQSEITVIDKYKPLHTVETEICRWRVPSDIKFAKSVVTVMQKGEQSLFFDWLANYRQYNILPVMVLNVGNDNSYLKACPDFVSQTKVDDTIDITNLEKYFILMKSLSQKTLYIDIHEKITGSVLHWFVDGLAVSDDKKLVKCDFSDSRIQDCAWRIMNQGIDTLDNNK